VASSGGAAHFEVQERTPLPFFVQLFAAKAQIQFFRSISINNATEASVKVQVGSRTFVVPSFSNVTQPHPPIGSVTIAVDPGPGGSPLVGSIYIAALEDTLSASSSQVITGGSGYVGP